MVSNVLAFSICYDEKLPREVRRVEIAPTYLASIAYFLTLPCISTLAMTSKITADIPLFTGVGSEDVTLWIQTIQRTALERDRQADDAWIASLAAASMAGPAMSWYVGLSEDQQSSWKKLRRAIMDRFAGGGASTSPKNLTLSPSRGSQLGAVSAPPTARSWSPDPRTVSPARPSEAGETTEGARVIYQTHASLFSSDADEGMWTNHGSGTVSIVAERDGKGARLLVQSTSPSKVLVDRPVTGGMTLTPESPTSWVWQARPDASLIEQKTSLTTRFPNTQNGQEFKKAFDTAAQGAAGTTRW